MQSSLVPANRKPVLVWLWCCVFMVTLMVVVGGLTRLTDSGLSMVEWQPIHGTLPPIGETEWQEELENYRQSPQYQQINKGMSVEEFKGIFWLEYIHRLLGRLVGLIFFLPFALFLLKRILPTTLSLRLAGIFLLGGAQGLMGWYMVKSGLVDVPWVSPLRLMAHLSLAFIIFGCLWWHMLLLRFPATTPEKPHPEKNLTLLSSALLFIQIMLGAIVAGLDAGLLYDTFPKMAGEWVPNEILALEPWHRNLYENPSMAHFIHRAAALLVTVSITILAVRLWNRPPNKLARYALYSLCTALAAQVALGVTTVVYQVPLSLAILHQLVALLLFAAMLTLLYSLMRLPCQKVVYENNRKMNGGSALPS